MHREGDAELTASQSRLWRRLFRVLEDPLKAIVLIDGGSVSLFRVLQQVSEFAKSPQLRAECNYVVVVPAESEKRDELIGAVRGAVADGELHGQCVDFVLDDYEAELPTMVWFVGQRGGVVLAEDRSLIQASGAAFALPYRLEPVVADKRAEPAGRLSSKRPTTVFARTQREPAPRLPTDLLRGATGDRG